MKTMKTEIAVIGGGPSGLAAADTLQRAGFEVLILEKGKIAENVSRFPTFMRFFSTPDLLELANYPLIVTDEKPSREQYLQYLRRFVLDSKLEIHLGHRVTAIEGESGEFRVTGTDRVDEPFEVEVTLCHWRAELGPLKYWIGPDIENRIKDGEIPSYMPARVKEIRPASVVIERDEGEVIEIENDYVLALTGYQPDPRFLEGLGINVDTETGRPEHNPKTLESNRPGLYMVGEMLSGRISGVIFIENSRTHGEQVAAHLKQEMAEGAMR